jgi:hypothetical protein
VVVAGLMFLSALQISRLYSKLYSGDHNLNNLANCKKKCEDMNYSKEQQKWTSDNCDKFCESERSKQMTKDSVNLMEPVKYSAAV